MSASAWGGTMHGPDVRISEAPLVNAVHRRLAEIALAVYTAVLVYICLVPFDFTRWKTLGPAPHRFLRLQWAGSGIPDILANLAIYLPLGALGYLVLRRLRLGQVTAGCCAVILAGLLSFAIEQGQFYVRSRVCSWSDVLANGLGAWLGVMAFAIWHGEYVRVAEQGRAAARRNWWSAVSKVAVCAVLIVHLRPYDVVVDVYHTAAGLRHADVGPLAAWDGLRERVQAEVQSGRRAGMHELPRVQWEYALDRITDVAGYAGLTVLLAMGLAGEKRRPLRLYAWIGFVVVSLAVMVTLIRIFLISHGLDTAHAVCGAIGWLLGCGLVVATGCARPECDAAGGAKAARTIPRGLQRAALTLALILVLLYELVPFDFATGAGARSPLHASMCLTPFEWHFLSRPDHAFYDISGELLRYGTMGACVALLLRRRGRGSWGAQLATTVLLTGAACFVLEALHLTMASRHTDITTLLLALAAALAGGIAVRWVHDYRAYLSTTVVDDPLTRQLIEGPGYDKAAAARPDSGRAGASRRDRAGSPARD